jgi:hypothetical protein
MRAKHSPLADVYEVTMSVAEALALVTAATQAVRSGFSDEDDGLLEEAVNAVLDQCSIDCEFDGDRMTLTYTGGLCDECSANREDN